MFNHAACCTSFVCNHTNQSNLICQGFGIACDFGDIVGFCVLVSSWYGWYELVLRGLFGENIYRAGWKPPAIAGLKTAAPLNTVGARFSCVNWIDWIRVRKWLVGPCPGPLQLLLALSLRRRRLLLRFAPRLLFLVRLVL